MSRRSGLLALWLGLAVLAAPGAVPGAAPSLDEAVAALEAAQRRVHDLKAPFVQTSHNRALNQSIEARGTLYLKKPGRLRWEYETPTPQEIVSDGTRLWIYTPSLRQVNVSSAPAALAGPTGSFLEGLGQVREHFHPRFLNPAQPTDAEGLVVLDLTPKQPQPLMARLIVAVDPATWLVRRAEVHDEVGNTVRVRFGAPVVNSGLPDSTFVFTPPPGVAVIQQ